MRAKPEQSHKRGFFNLTEVHPVHAALHSHSFTFLVVKNVRPEHVVNDVFSVEGDALGSFTVPYPSGTTPLLQTMDCAGVEHVSSSQQPPLLYNAMHKQSR